MPPSKKKDSSGTGGDIYSMKEKNWQSIVKSTL